MVQSFSISFYHCTDVIVHAYSFLDVIEPLVIALMLLCLMLGFIDVLEPLVMTLMLLCIMWDSLML